MHEQEILNLLRDTELNSYEAKCYLALLKSTNLTATECARFADIPPTKVHMTLRGLVEKGLISQTNDKPMSFHLIQLKYGILKYLSNKKKFLDNLEKELKSNLPKIKSVEKPEIIERVIVKTGRENQHELAFELVKTAKKDMRVISAGERIPTKLLIESKRAINKGVKIKYILTKLEGNEDLIKQFKEFGYIVKINSNLGYLFMAIKDAQNSLLIIKNPKNLEDRISILIQDEALSRVHAKYFEEMWKKSRNI